MVILFVLVSNLINKKAYSILTIWWITPLVFLLFYHGNYGYVWEYYFTGVFSIFSLLVGIILSVSVERLRWTRPLVIVLLIVVFWQNILSLKSYLTAGTYGPVNITLGPS